MTNTVPEKTHASLGASKAHIWMNCPGSVALERSLPPEGGGDSFYAREGTAAHALAELCLRKDQEPAMFVGTSLEGVEVTEDMAEFTAIYVDYCSTSIRFPSTRAGAAYFIERQFNLGHLNPPGPMFGTADFVSYNPTLKELEVVDLKYGQGVVVDVNENKQLRYYALGAALTLPELDIEDVKMTIVQPRATHKDGVIRSETIPLIELIGFANQLLDAARETTIPGAVRTPGSHCRWCKASGRCPEQRDRAQDVAMVEFAAVPMDVPPNPTAIPIMQLAEWIPKFGILEDWIAACRKQLEGALLRGEVVPGYKLVQKRANRSWKDELETYQHFAGKYSEDELMTKKLKSPAQIEKLVGKKNLPEELTQKISSGVTVAPEADARPAVSGLTAAEEFTALPGGTEG